MIRKSTLRLLAAVSAFLLVVGAAVAADEGGDDAYPHGRFREDCSECHGSEGWSPAVISPKFDHAKHGFPLKGAHRSAKCIACHAKLDFANALTDCVSCHSDIHRGELGPDCSRCHTTNSFVERADEIRTHRMSRFPLAGAHLALDCRDCHRPSSAGHLTFVNTPGECQSCHLNDYQTAANPDHVAAGFTRDCQHCHTEVSWTGRGFDHRLTGFALKGAHRSLACTDCHTNGYSATSAACVDCHQADYDQTTNPDHRAAGFPTDCASCHSTSGWLGAKFDHRRYFPIYSGAHAGRWTSCSDCHTNPSNFSAFSCLNCHPHSDKTTTDGHHSGVSGYVYDSAACYDCHPNGRSE